MQNPAPTRLTVKQAAAISKMGAQFIRVGMQRELFPFGSAVKLSSKWTYHIPFVPFCEYVGIEPEKALEILSLSEEATA
ncbi:hypothetical protein [Desulfitobacterium hafniense]|uniref:hypothetical protein n=1 Tax=Desulfitobacterium hafniense TaxID=49338 RepID=UPI00036B4E00|nr:hypothetical protein [Desulfitobacterium hafniense]